MIRDRSAFSLQANKDVVIIADEASIPLEWEQHAPQVFSNSAPWV